MAARVEAAGAGLERVALEARLELLTPVHVYSGESVPLGLAARVAGGWLELLDVECAVRLAGLGLDELAALSEAPAALVDRLWRAAREGGGCLERLPARTGGVQPRGEVRLLNPMLVPASSLKGLLHTALMLALVDRLDGRGLDVGRLVYDAIARLQRSRRPARDATRAAEELEKALFLTERPVGRQRMQHYSTRLLSVSEPEPLEAGRSFRVFQRLHTDGRPVRGAAYPVVAVDEGSRLRYRLTLLRIPLSLAVGGLERWGFRKLEEMDSRVSLDTLLEGLRLYSRLLHEYETRRLGGGLRDYRGWLESQEPVDGSCFLVRLGFGAGHMAKTVDEWLRRRYPRLYEDLKRVMSSIYRRDWDDRTTTVDAETGLGVGWTRLCIDKIPT